MYSKVLKKYNPYTDEQTMRIYGQFHSYHEDTLGGDWYWWARIENGKIVAIGEENGGHCGGEHANSDNVEHLKSVVQWLGSKEAGEQCNDLYEKLKQYGYID